MATNSRMKRRAMRKPKRSRRGGSNWFNGAVAAVLAVGIALVLVSRGGGTSAGSVGPKMDGAGGQPEHWHAALGINVCGKWQPSTPWPISSGSQSRGRAGNPSVYAGLHGHELADGSGDGIIHMEPALSEEAGRNATVGKYMKYGGWSVNKTSMKLWVGDDGKKIERKNGQKCGNKEAKIRWSIGKQEAGKTAKLVEQTGDPSKFKLYDQTIVAVYFVAADEDLTKLGEVPSIPNLSGATERGEGAMDPNATTTSIAGGTTVPGATTTTAPGTSTTTAAGETTTTAAATTSTTVK